jgi:ATP-dependent exoDNAse (exonuclease V) alpha subunit
LSRRRLHRRDRNWSSCTHSAQAWILRARLSLSICPDLLGRAVHALPIPPMRQYIVPCWAAAFALASWTIAIFVAPLAATGVDAVLRLARENIPRRFGLHPLDDIQVLTPMQRGSLGARSLNLALQAALNPSGPFVERFGWTFRVGDKVMQTSNDYQKDVFNGDIGRIAALDEEEQELVVKFEGREVVYDLKELDELTLCYATTIHKSQGSEYPAVVIPIHTQHFPLLQRNLLYTAMTRGKRLVVLVGTKKAIALAVKRFEVERRVTTLRERLSALRHGSGRNTS